MKLWCRKTRQDVFNAMGSMYAAVLFIGVQNATSVQPVVAIERTVFYRERAAGMYSALPFAFGQVCLYFPHACYIVSQRYVWAIINSLYHRWTRNKSNIDGWLNITGGYGDPLRFRPNYSIWCYCVRHDWFRMDSKQVLVVYFLHVLHLSVLHILWDDVRGRHSGSECCCLSFLCLLRNMEPVLWIHSPKNGKDLQYYTAQDYGYVSTF